MISEEPMFGLRSTLYPFARSACAYSSPRTYCSVKFLSPRVTAGLPLPGWAPPPAAAPPELELVVLLSLDEPHAARASARATANRAVRPRIQVLVVIGGFLLRGSGSVGGSRRPPRSGRRRSRPAVRAASRVAARRRTAGRRRARARRRRSP